MLFGIEPEQFDVLGVFAFLLISVIALAGVMNPKSVPRWIFVVLLGVGLAGLIVDIAIVLNYLF